MEPNKTNEAALLQRIMLLFAILSLSVVAQSIISIKNHSSLNNSFEIVNQSNIQVEEIALEISVPISKIRMVSMELVLAPNKKLIDEISTDLHHKIASVDSTIIKWHSDIKSGKRVCFHDDLHIDEEISIAWKNYKKLVKRTATYVKKSDRVASFISVSGDENVAFQKLVDKLSSHQYMKNAHNKDIYIKARNSSTVAFATLLTMTVISLILLALIIYTIQRSVRGYIRDKQKYESELSAAMVKANSANKAKSEFLANMSHEIRTPMNAVLGFTEILMGLEVDKKKAHYIDNIHTSGHALLNLINDILDLSKIEAGKLALQYDGTSVQSLFKEMQTIFQQKIADKGLNFIVEVNEQVPTSLILDEARIRQILVNLIGNAIKFTEQGEIRLNVSIQNTDIDTHSRVDLTIEVQDTGVGIPKNQQSKIFEAFEQTAGQKTAEFGGTGLGLAITNRLVEMMDGEITIESELGEGATFRVHLKGVEVAATEALTTKQSKQLDFDTITFEPATILIADDIDYNREMISTYLDQWDFNLIEATNGREAIEQVQAHHPDLLLLDMKMPVMNGYEATEKLKADEKLEIRKGMKLLPIIAVTASALKSDERKIATICDGYLRKPITKSDLVTKLMKFLPCSVVNNVPQSLEEQNQQPGTIPLTSETLKNFPQLLVQLQLKANKANELVSSMLIADIGEFAAEIKLLSNAHNCPVLSSWANETTIATDNFNLDAIKQLMNRFLNAVNS